MRKVMKALGLAKEEKLDKEIKDEIVKTDEGIGDETKTDGEETEGDLSPDGMNVYDALSKFRSFLIGYASFEEIVGGIDSFVSVAYTGTDVAGFKSMIRENFDKFVGAYLESLRPNLEHIFIAGLGK